MARSVFFCFHYQRDITRVNIICNHAKTKASYIVAGYWDHSLWEMRKARGDRYTKELIAEGLKGTSVTVVLIGNETATRPWVKYEIDESISRGNGVLGVYIHNIENLDGHTDTRGGNPLPDVYKTYDWKWDNGYDHFGTWVEAAARAAGK